MLDFLELEETVGRFWHRLVGDTASLPHHPQAAVTLASMAPTLAVCFRGFGGEPGVRVVKNKVCPPFKTAEFDILYGEGISREGEILDLGVTAKIVDKSGAWYAYKGEKIGQGKDNSREFLRENPDLAHEIENRIRESLGVSLLPATDSEGA
mgnify:CR=1 FL=1